MQKRYTYIQTECLLTIILNRWLKNAVGKQLNWIIIKVKHEQCKQYNKVIITKNDILISGISQNVVFNI